MYITSLHLENFGPFDSLDATFPSLGVSTIFGVNASGKTQMVGSVIAALAGKSALRVNHDGVGPSAIQLRLTDGEIEEVSALEIYLQPNGNCSSTRTIKNASGAIVAETLGHRLRESLRSDSGPKLLLPIDPPDRKLRVSDFPVIEGTPAFKNLPADLQRQVHRAFADHYASSIGLKIVVECLKEYAVRYTSREAFPLIIDDALSLLSKSARAAMYDLLLSLGKNSQVLLLSTDREMPFDLALELQSNTGNHTSLSSYRYFHLPPKRRLHRRRRPHLGRIRGRDKLTVFLCYASDDKPLVRDLYRQLREDGAEPWLDVENLLPGQQWKSEAERALRGSHVVLVCLSKQAIRKTGFVQKEIAIALEMSDQQPEGAIYLIPVMLEPCELPERLNHLHAEGIYQGVGYEKLLHSLSAKIESLSHDTGQCVDRDVWHTESSMQ